MNHFTNKIRRRINDVYKGNHRMRRISSPRHLPDQTNDEQRAFNSDARGLPRSGSCGTADSKQPQGSGSSPSVNNKRDREVPNKAIEFAKERVPIEDSASVVDECKQETQPRDDDEVDAPEDAVIAPAIPTVTWEDAQKVREATYVTFNSEDETDYTKGPVRMVLAPDGVEWVVALLMNLPLSQSIQNALKHKRYYEQRRRDAARRKQQLMHLSLDVESEIASHESKLVQMRNEIPAHNPKRLDLQSHLSMLELMLKEIEYDIRSTDVDMDTACGIARDVYEGALSQLDDGFVQASLLEPEKRPKEQAFEDLDLQAEYEKFCEHRRQCEHADEVPATDLDTDREYLTVPTQPMTQEEEETERLMSIVWWSSQRLERAQAAFDRGKEDWNAEIDADYNFAIAAEQPTDGIKDESGHGWLVRLQELTHELQEAEDAYAEAKAAAASVGLDIPLDDRTSDFVDDADDGYPLSLEREIAASAPTPRINDWISGMPGGADFCSPGQDGELVDADDWDFREVELSDSISTFAQDYKRNQIQRWRKNGGM